MTTAAKIVIPYKPLPIQAWIHKNLKRFSVVVLHRGCGKSILAVNELIRRAFTCSDTSGAQFIYVAPEKQQAKNIIWNKLKYYTKDIPDLRIREDELTITFPDNGATICLEGADNPDRLRGRHPHFVVLDEVGQMKRDVWYEVIMPGTMANAADVLFIGTPKGDNLFKEIYEIGKKAMDNGDPSWFTARVDVFHSKRYTLEEVELIRKTMPQAKFNQEYLCDFEASFTGAFYGELLDSGSVMDVPYDPSKPVITGWDLGTADKTAIWFAQQDGETLRLIDYYENSGQDIFFYINYIRRKPYFYNYHILPHDSAKHFLTSSKSVEGIFKSSGLKVVKAPRLGVKEGISVVQAALYRCRFDKHKCAAGVRHLSQYRSKVDALSGLDTGEPLHDAASDAADAFRTLVLGIKKPNQQEAEKDFSWLTGQPPVDKNRYQSYDVFNT